MESFLESAEYTVYQNRTLRYFYLLQLRFLRVAKNKRNERLLYSFRLGDTYGENIKKKKERVRTWTPLRQDSCFFHHSHKEARSSTQ